MHREINRDDMASVRMGNPMFVCSLCNNILRAIFFTSVALNLMEFWDFLASHVYSYMIFSRFFTSNHVMTIIQAFLILYAVEG